MRNKPNQNAQLHVKGPWDKLKEKEDHSKEFERALRTAAKTTGF